MNDIVGPPEQGVKMPPELHEYVPSSRWTGRSGYPKWAACSGCDYRGPVRYFWAVVESDYVAHLDQIDGEA